MHAASTPALVASTLDSATATVSAGTIDAIATPSGNVNAASAIFTAGGALCAHGTVYISTCLCLQTTTVNWAIGTQCPIFQPWS